MAFNAAEWGYRCDKAQGEAGTLPFRPCSQAKSIELTPVAGSRRTATSWAQTSTLDHDPATLGATHSICESEYDCC